MMRCVRGASRPTRGRAAGPASAVAFARLLVLVLVLALLQLLFASASFAQSSAAAMGEPPVETQAEAAAKLRAQLDAAPPSAAGSPRVLYIGAAMDDSSTAFVGDVQLAESSLRRVAPQLVALRLGNGEKPDDWPDVSDGSMRAAFAAAAQLLPADAAQARVVVLLTSHGGVGLLSTSRSETQQSAADAETIAAWLRPLGDAPTLLVISACHAGSLIRTLQRPNRIVIAAAAADRASFGCDDDAQNTYFSDELFNAHFEPALPIRQWFVQARRGVGARERAMRLRPPSNPQIWVAAPMEPVAATTLADWLNGARR